MIITESGGNQTLSFKVAGTERLNTGTIDNTWSGGCVGLYRATSSTTTTLQWDDFKCGYDENGDGDNPTADSAVTVAEQGADKSRFSTNHGAGRQMDRKQAIRTLDQQFVDGEFDAADILTNCRQYPKDEAPAAYKDFGEVVYSVEQAGLATTVAKLRARFVIKDADKADD